MGAGRGVPRRPASKVEWSKEIRGADLTPTEGWVLTILHGYTDRYCENAHPGWAVLSRDTRLTEKTVKRAVRSLLAKGYLTRTAVGGGRGRASVYRLTLPQETGVAGALLSDPEKGVENAPFSDEKGGHFAPEKGGTSRPEKGVPVTPPSSNRSSSSSSRARARASVATATAPPGVDDDDAARQEAGRAERDPWLVGALVDEGQR